MKKHTIEICGRVTNDGRLSMYMEELKDFCKNWPNTRIIATFRVYAPKTSEALKGYYFNYVVPRCRQALWEIGDRKTDEQTERWLREMSPIMHLQTADPDSGQYMSVLREVKDLDNSELIEHIETIKQFMAENYYVIIDDPATI